MITITHQVNAYPFAELSESNKSSAVLSSWNADICGTRNQAEDAGKQKVRDLFKMYGFSSIEFFIQYAHIQGDGISIQTAQWKRSSIESPSIEQYKKTIPYGFLDDLTQTGFDDFSIKYFERGGVEITSESFYDFGNTQKDMVFNFLYELSSFAFRLYVDHLDGAQQDLRSQLEASEFSALFSKDGDFLQMHL